MISNMLIAYVDESGNTGAISQGGTLSYSLGCVLIDADAWPAVFDEMLSFRRRLRDRFGLQMSAEVKASSLLRSSGDLRSLGLAPGQRHLIYRAHLRQLAVMKTRAFAIVVDKTAKDRAPTEVFDLAWEGLLQRLERTSTYESVTFAIMHDEGENDAIRRWVRKSRRYLPAGSAYGTGSITHRASLLIDDPIPRKSHQSYLIQMADLVAYAAFRAQFVPSRNIAMVCPQDMWDEIGAATHTAVARLRPRAKPGIVLR